MKISQEHLTDWPTKQAVADALGCTTKTVERYADRGRLRKQFRHMAGRKPVPVFDPEDVKKLHEEQEEGARMRSAELMQEGTHSRSESLASDERGMMAPRGGVEIFKQLAVMGENIASATEALGSVVEELTTALRLQADMQTAAREAARRPAIATESKMVLTLSEAATLGFVRRQLREMVREGKLRNLGTASRPRVARAQLERLWRADADQKGTA